MISKMQCGSRQKEYYDISVIVLIYEQPLEEILLTLASIIGQKNADFQIIISDDGSTTPFLQKCIDFMEKVGFRDYKIIWHQYNVGTVINYIDALEKADGKYIKSLGPGDCFGMEDAIQLWVDDMKKEGSRLSFCDAIYYRKNGEKYESVVEVALPQNLQVYTEKKKLQKKYYLLYNDIFSAVTVMCEKSLIYKYIEIIRSWVKYAEDNMFRLMILDGIEGAYFAHKAVYYEWGSGVSTKENIHFKKVIKQEWEKTTEYICKHCSNNWLENKIRNYYMPGQGNESFVSKIFYELARLDVLIYEKRNHNKKRLTVHGDLGYLYTLKNLYE